MTNNNNAMKDNLENMGDEKDSKLETLFSRLPVEKSKTDLSSSILEKLKQPAINKNRHWEILYLLVIVLLFGITIFFFAYGDAADSQEIKTVSGKEKLLLAGMLFILSLSVIIFIRRYARYKRKEEQ